MSWTEELDELERRRSLAAQMGGAEGVARQHARGKLTVHERLALLADADTFGQFAALKGEGRYRADGTLEDFVPAGQVDGMCRIDARKVVVTAGDLTVLGGTESR
jgi:acetyl-CoA carboxylase carboxyltransferase component